MMLQLPDSNRRFAAQPAQYSAACDRRLSLFGVSCRGNYSFSFFALLFSFPVIFLLLYDLIFIIFFLCFYYLVSFMSFFFRNNLSISSYFHNLRNVDRKVPRDT